MLTSCNTAPHNRYQPHPAELEQHTKCSNRAFVLLKMGIMMLETCWDTSNNKHLIVASCWFFLSSYIEITTQYFGCSTMIQHVSAYITITGQYSYKIYPATWSAISLLTVEWDPILYSRVNKILGNATIFWRHLSSNVFIFHYSIQYIMPGNRTWWHPFPQAECIPRNKILY